MVTRRHAELVYDGQSALARSKETPAQRRLAKALYAIGVFVNRSHTHVVSISYWVKHPFTGKLTQIRKEDVQEFRNHGAHIITIV